VSSAPRPVHRNQYRKRVVGLKRRRRRSMMRSSQQVRLCCGAAAVIEAGIDYEAAFYDVSEDEPVGDSTQNSWVAPASSPVMALTPALHIFTHNVRGRVKRVDVIAFVRTCWDTGAHIVCFQDTWADCRGGLCSAALTLFLDDACKAVGLRGVPDLLLTSNTLGPGHRAGVGILVLHRPVTELVLLKYDAHSTPDGRVVWCGVRWSGHRLSLVKTYWPTSAPRRGQLPSASRHAYQRRFFTEVLLPVVQPCTAGSLVIVGVFNLPPMPPIAHGSRAPLIAPHCHLGLPAILTGVQRRQLPYKSSLLSRPLGMRWWMHSGRCTVEHKIILTVGTIPALDSTES
jgi:hypothetical protein